MFGAENNSAPSDVESSPHPTAFAKAKNEGRGEGEAQGFACTFWSRCPGGRWVAGRVGTTDVRRNGGGLEGHGDGPDGGGLKGLVLGLEDYRTGIMGRV